MPFREEVLNVKLAELLCSYGLKANPETITNHKKLPDVSIIIEGIRIILEGRLKDEKNLERKAKERIEQGLCEICLTVQYENVLKNSDTTEQLAKRLSKFKYNGAIYYRGIERIEKNGFKEINIAEFVQLISRAYGLIVDNQILTTSIEIVKSNLDTLVEYAMGENLWFTDELVVDQLKLLLAIDDTAIKLTTKLKKDIIMIALFVLFDAAIFHESISSKYREIKSLLNSSKPHKIFFSNQWKKILKIDYKPIFLFAKNIIDAFPTDAPYTEFALNHIKELALKIVSTGILRRHDFMGRIYHKLLLKTTGEYYATYYTSVPAAYILSNLLFLTKNNNWDFNNLDDLSQFKVIDPACGSGTLLSASYVALRNIYTDVLTDKEYDEFHKILLEKSIFGWDVLDFATHLTLTVLALHNPKSLIRRSNIATLPNGRDENGNIHLGSLTFLETELEFVGSTWSKGIRVQNMNVIDELFEHLDISNNMFDVVIMNPPFSRSAGAVNVKFGYSNKVIKEQMQKKLDKILKKENLIGIGHAGLGAIFIYLGHKILKDNGRIAIVIPRAILNAISWKKIREILYKNYEIKFIISNYDAGNENVDKWSWSEDTTLGEVMIIAEKTTKLQSERKTTFVNFWNKPENEIESMMCSYNIVNHKVGDISKSSYNELELKDKTIGTYYQLDQNKLKNLNWLMPCLFSNPMLNKLTLDIHELLLKKGIHFRDIIETKKIKNRIIHLGGADRKIVNANFDVSNIKTGYFGLFGYTNKINRLFLKNELQSIRLKTSKSKDYFHTYSSKLLVAERFWADNSRLTSMYCEEKCITNMFWEIILNKTYNDKEKNIVLWLNSTYGLITYLSNCINNMGSWFNLKKENMMDILLPKELFKIDKSKINKLFTQLKDDNLLKLKEEFLLAESKEGTKYLLDKFFEDELKLKIDLKNFYIMLKNEPFFTLERLNINSITLN